MIRRVEVENLDKRFAVRYPHHMRKSWSRCLAIASIAALFSLQLHSLVHDASEANTAGEVAGDCEVCAVARVATAAVSGSNLADLVPVFEADTGIRHATDAPLARVFTARIPSPRGPPLV
jgi:hypothetical protein